MKYKTKINSTTKECHRLYTNVFVIYRDRYQQNAHIIVIHELE